MAVLGGDGHEILDAQAAEVFRPGVEGFDVDFVYGEKDGFAGTQQQAGQIDVGRGQFGAAIDNHHDSVGFFERGLCLTINFRRDKRLVIGNNAAGIDQPRGVAGPAYFAVNAVAGYAGFIPDN